jgi:hypothetical protein
MAKITTEEAVVKVEKVFWEKPDGKLVPVESITDEDIAKDKLVTELIEDAEELQRVIIKAKARLTQKIDDYLAARATAKLIKNWKGNAIITDFSGAARVVRKIGKFMVFDEKLQLAKQIIDECVIQWSGDSNSNLVAMVNMAFDVNNSGAVDRDAILGLKKLKVDGPTKARWQEAMDLIFESQMTQATKPYDYFQQKDADGVWQNIVLDYGALGVRRVLEADATTD